MSDTATAILTAGLTAGGGLVVFVVGNFTVKILVEPIQEQRKLMGEVAQAILFFANVNFESFIKVGRRRTEARKDVKAAVTEIRQLAGKLQASVRTIPFYPTLTWMGVVPSRKKVLDAAAQMVGWSNSIWEERHESWNRLDEVSRNLDILRANTVIPPDPPPALWRAWVCISAAIRKAWSGERTVPRTASGAEPASASVPQ